MATVKEMIAEHNDLARKLGRDELTGWKQAGEKLQARIDAMNAEMDARTEDAGDPLELVTEEDRGFDVIDPATEQADPLETTEEPATEQADGVIGDVLDVVEAIKAEKTKGKGKKAKAPKAEKPVDERGTIGQMVKDLLLDAEGYDYQEIVDIVKGEFPEANTSRRSVASVAAELRRKGTEVPMRRKQKGEGK